MKKLLLILLFLPMVTYGQLDIKKVFKFATFYGAVNGGTSISDVNVYSITNGLNTEVINTPFDFAITFGVRKIARFGYENRANTFYDGTEKSYSDAATLGKIKGFEFLFEADYKRTFGNNYLDQHHFVRYVNDKWIAKVEYLQDGFADIQYFEASERYRHKLGDKLSINIGAVQRFAEPYGYDPLQEWILSNDNLHYTYLAINEMGYSVDVFSGEYYNPSGELVATSTEIWEEVVIPQALDEYATQQKDLLSRRLEYSVVVGYDYYHYTKSFWLHSWANMMPYHLDTGGDYSYHKFNGDAQWMDYSMGLIFGYKFNKKLGVFTEGTYNKYWNRKWHNFSIGVNYVIF